MVCDQCHYLGVIDAINLRRTGYRYRSLFVDFYQRYSVIDTNRFELSHVQDESLAKPECKQLVANFKRIPMLLHTGFCYKSPVVVGDSLVFMKHEAFERLEKQREWQTNTLSRYCIWIQVQILTVFCLNFKQYRMLGGLLADEEDEQEASYQLRKCRLGHDPSEPSGVIVKSFVVYS